MTRFPAVFQLGRNPECDIEIRDETVSRLHAEVVLSANGRIFLTDRDSTYGTWIDDGTGWRKIQQHEPKEGENLRFGDFEVAVVALSRIATSLTKDEEMAVTVPSEGHPKKRRRPRRNPVTGRVE